MAVLRHQRMEPDDGRRGVFLSRGRALMLAAVAVVWALLSPSLGAALLPSETITRWGHDLVDSEQEKAVKNFVETARHATTWVAPPTVYAPSVKYFEDHFEEMNPAKPHQFPPPTDALVPMGALATESATLTGRPINVAGNVFSSPTVVTPVTEDLGSFAVAVRDRTAPGTLALCRLPYKRPLPFDHGDRVTFRGLVIADGLIHRPQGEGMRHVVYMACTSMVHSTNLTLKFEP